MNDIAEKLRDYGRNPMVQSEYSMVPARELLEAADEIERLRGLLREIGDIGWLQAPHPLTKRIREALGDD